MADFPNSTRVFDWIKNDNPSLQKEHILKYLEYFLENNLLTITELIETHDISLYEADKACNTDILRVLYDALSLDVFDATLEKLDKIDRTAVLNLAGKADTVITDHIFKVLKVSRNEILGVVKGAAIIGYTGVLACLISEHKITKEEIHTGRIFHYAAIKGHVKAVEILVEYYKFTKEDVLKNDGRTFAWAAQNGHLSVIQWLTDKFSLVATDIFEHNEYALLWTADEGKLDVLKWIVKQFRIRRIKIEDIIIELFVRVAENGHLDVLQWMTKEFTITRKDVLTNGTLAFQRAAWGGYLDVLKWMTKEFELTKKDVMGDELCAFCDAADYGHLPVVKWIVKYFKLTIEDVDACLEHIIAEAENDGYDEMAQWLTKKFKRPHRGVSIDAIGLISGAPLEMRLKLLHLVLKSNPGLAPSEVKRIINGVCVNGQFLCISQMMGTETLDIIAEVYDLRNKSRDEATKVLRRICNYDVPLLGQNLKYLVSAGVIPEKDPEPPMTIDKVRELFPKYVIVKPDELVERVKVGLFD